jgi:hypothetical protein
MGNESCKEKRVIIVIMIKEEQVEGDSVCGDVLS